MKKEEGLITEDKRIGLIDGLINEILDAYSSNPNLKSLPRSRLFSVSSSRDNLRNLDVHNSGLTDI